MLHLSALEAYRHCANALEEMGLRLTQEEAHPGLIAEMEAIGKTPATMVLPETSDVTQENSLWLTLRRGDALVGTLSARLDCVEPGRTGLFIERMLRRYWSAADSEVSVDLPDHLAKDLEGASVYAGDLFLESGERGSPDKVACFTLCAQSLIFLKFPQARAIYIFIRLEEARQKALLYGLVSGMQPMVADWTNPPKARDVDEAICWVTRDHYFSYITALLKRPNYLSQWPQRPNPRYDQPETTHSPEPEIHPAKRKA